MLNKHSKRGGVYRTNSESKLCNIQYFRNLKVAVLAFSVYSNLFMLTPDNFAMKTDIQLMTFSSFCA